MIGGYYYFCTAGVVNYLENYPEKCIVIIYNIILGCGLNVFYQAA
jgi:hypothetical protein